LRQGAVQTVVIAGLTTPHCVSASTRTAKLGFEVYLAGDAVAAFEITGPDGKHYPAEEIHRVSLATLHQEFATVLESKVLLDSIEQA
jgi:nicotinamidase-related amidase